MPHVRANLRQVAFVATADQVWVPSPAAGVERVMLDRVGDEEAVATSLVRYAKGMRFPPHLHPMGEEFLVLDGVFSDQHGDYGAGTYVRNPPGSGHAPFSDPGCLLFVKLRQFEPEDGSACVIDTSSLADAIDQPERHVLHHFRDEQVSIISARQGQTVRLGWHELVREVLCLRGRQRVDGHDMTATAWLRLPPGRDVEMHFLTDGRVFSKTRSLRR